MRKFKLDSHIKESDIQAVILDYLASLPRAKFWKNKTTGTYDPKIGGFRKMHGRHNSRGSPDILGTIDGKFIGIEVKKPSGIVSTDQQDFINHLNKVGAIAFVARSLDDVISVMRKYGYVS